MSIILIVCIIFYVILLLRNLYQNPLVRTLPTGPLALLAKLVCNGLRGLAGSILVDNLAING